jgi:hypothetical protein
LTISIAILAWFWLPMGPGSAWFLTPTEKEFATERMRIDSEKYIVKTYGPDGLQAPSDRLHWRDVIETAKDWKLWTALTCNICASVPSQAFSVFLPLVVNGLGYTSIKANLVSNHLYDARGLAVQLRMRCADAVQYLDVCSTICLWCCGPISFRLEL